MERMVGVFTARLIALDPAARHGLKVPVKAHWPPHGSRSRLLGDLHFMGKSHKSCQESLQNTLKLANYFTDIASYAPAKYILLRRWHGVDAGIRTLVLTVPPDQHSSANGGVQ